MIQTLRQRRFVIEDKQYQSIIANEWRRRTVRYRHDGGDVCLRKKKSSSSLTTIPKSARCRGGERSIFQHLKLDQYQNVTDLTDSWMSSAVEVQRAFVQSALVDRAALQHHQENNDVLQSAQALKQAFRTDVGPIMAMARLRNGAAADPVACYRQAGYRAQKREQRPPRAGASGSGIV